MFRLFKIILIFFIVTQSAAPAPGAVPSPLKPISFAIQGTVTDITGKPVTGARVVLASGEEKKSAPQNTRTGTDGKWKFQRVKDGHWKIQAFSKEAVSEIYHITISWRKDRHELIPIHLKLRVTSREILAQGKRHLYSHQWEPAGKAFDFFCLNFPDSMMADEALFWKAYTCFRQARASREGMGSEPVSLRELSLKAISQLLEKFSAGKWSQDARILRLDIWNDQFRSGHRSDLEPVMRAADPKIEPNGQVRRAAIEILISTKPGFAWSALQREFSQMEDAKLRQNVLVLFARFERAKAAPALKLIAKNDPDPLVRAGARYWLNRVERLSSGNPASEL